MGKRSVWRGGPWEDLRRASSSPSRVFEVTRQLRVSGGGEHTEHATNACSQAPTVVTRLSQGTQDRERTADSQVRSAAITPAGSG